MQKPDLRDLNLNLLVVLDALLETHSVSGAAKKLHLSQPAISRSLSLLREMFGDPLFVRSAHGMLPTPRAETLAAPLAQTLEAAVGLISAERFDPAESSAVFRVSTTDYGAIAVIAPALERFAAEAPKAAIEVVPVTAETFRDLAAGKIELMLYTGAEVPPSLRTRPLFQESYVCLVRRSHPLAGSKTERISLDDFVAWPHALVTVFGGRRGVVDAALAERGLTRRVVLWVPYFSVAPLMIQQTDAILTLPSKIAQAFLAMDSLMVLKPPLEISRFAYRLLWHERTHSDPALRWLRRLLVDVACTADEVTRSDAGDLRSVPSGVARE